MNLIFNMMYIHCIGNTDFYHHLKFDMILNGDQNTPHPIYEFVDSKLITCSSNWDNISKYQPNKEFKHKRVYVIDSNIVTMIKYVSKPIKYQLFSPHIGWYDTPIEMIHKYPNVLKESCEDNPDVAILINKLGGFRPDTSSYVPKDNDELIPKEYKQSTYVTDKNCVWLSAVMVIDSVDVNAAKKMMIPFVENPKVYDWIPLFDKKKLGIFWLLSLDIYQNCTMKFSVSSV